MSPERALLTVGALFGAAGIVLLALAAHGSFTGGTGAASALNAAGVMMLANGVALLAAGVALRVGLLAPRLGALAGVALAAGVMLFTGDVTRLTLQGEHLFAYAAPIGGTLSILAWLALALAALLAPRGQGGARDGRA